MAVRGVRSHCPFAAYSPLALLAGEHAAHNVFFNHADRNAHMFGDPGVAHFVENMQHKGLTATGWQCLDRGQISVNDLL